VEFWVDMNLRQALLGFVASPDRAWLTLLGGALLIARECVAPGRVIPGLLGGVMLITAGYYLPGAVPGLIGVAALLYLHARRTYFGLPAAAAGALAVFTARRAGTGWPAALLSVGVVAIVAFLIRIGTLAHRRKVSAQP
jgi:hypothetical protein